MNKLTSLLVPVSFLLSLAAVSVVVINPTPGPAGSSGTQGIIGLSGATGPTGPVGPQGESGATGTTGETGSTGATGESGQPGENGLTPYIGVNGYWWIGDVDTGVRATPVSSSDYIDSLQYRHTELNLLAKYAEPLSNVLPNLTNQASYVLDRVNQDGFTIIDSPTALMTIANPLGKYVLDRNLDLSTLTNWSPITFSEGFQGVLDGAGYMVSGLITSTMDINLVGQPKIGLFGHLNGASIRNLDIDAFTFQSPTSSSVGALAGESRKTHFYNLSMTNSSIEGFELVGGLVGSSILDLGDEITVDSTTVKGDSDVGGIAGSTIRSAWMQILTGGQNHIITTQYNGGGMFGSAVNIVLLNSANYGIITTPLSNTNSFIFSIGGVVGDLEFSFIHSLTNYAMVALPIIPNMFRIENVGGIAGRAVSSQIWFATNDAHVLVHANDINPFYIESVGGIVGDAEMVEILYSINLGPVDVISPNTQDPVDLTEYVAGIIGYQRSSGAILHSVNLGQIQGYKEVAGLVGGTGAVIWDIWSQLEIRESMNLGVIRGFEMVGGLVGSIDAFYELIIEDSFNDGDIFGDFILGGLVGFIGTKFGSHSKITRSYNAGTITGNYVIGGLVGAAAANFFDDPSTIDSGKLSIEYAFNVGEIIVEEMNIIFLMDDLTDYRWFNVGAIIGARFMTGQWLLVTYVAETTLIPISAYDEATDEFVLTDEFIEATLYASGNGYGFDAFSVMDVSAYGRHDFFYADYWNLNQVWDVNHTYDTYDLPILRRNAFNFLVF